ncbi:uncharacterized protein LOC124256983 [Haliotis rubra]|uniref:uncharacterized protein LOC124256983 n=1 Tax=Haliotis rubra TaxID=36100 RepID=UPI001EE552AA|nr:uncharacterized protein LOC124256983 [Haliotis rubra]
MTRRLRIYGFFGSWILLALCGIVLNILNIDWAKTSTPRGIFIILVVGVLQGSVMEFPVMTLATLLLGGNRRENNCASADHLSLVLNYNLLAVSQDDIDECLQTMYSAYMGNLSENVCAVLVSATISEELKAYELEVRDNFRALVYSKLFWEGIKYASGNRDLIDSQRLQHIWSKYDDMDTGDFRRTYLEDICHHFAHNFMVIHRVTKVLKKCGQYQDLMLLSNGDTEAYTYTDPEYYGSCARPPREPLFHESEDTKNIYDRHFDYTFVLDSDTMIEPGFALKLLKIAAAHPERGIIQPAIKLHCTFTDTLFMSLEQTRQDIYEPMTNAVTDLLGQSSYFGKALIRNSVYIENVIGTRDNLIERVPVDVLSHDTFEAALLKPLYVGSVYLLEAPSYNYVAWNIRERRWNRGEVLLSMYFWKNAIGKPMRWIQRKLQGEKFNATKLRTESKLDFVTSYIAHSALRQMFMKPLLLAFIVIHYQTHLHYRYASIIIVMFLVLVFPKFATCTRENYKFVFLETVASILQFTPEAMVGCVRIVRAIQANITANVHWIPQRAVEEEFKSSNPFLSAWKHLWGYSLVSLILAGLVAVYFTDGMFMLFMLCSLFVLPFYTGVTCLTPNMTSTRRTIIAEDEESLIGTGKTPPANKDHVKPATKRKSIFRCFHMFGVCFFLDDQYYLNRV